MKFYSRANENTDVKGQGLSKEEYAALLAAVSQETRLTPEEFKIVDVKEIQ